MEGKPLSAVRGETLTHFSCVQLLVTFSLEPIRLLCLRILQARTLE